MSKKHLNLFFPNYDFADLNATTRDAGFIKNHIDSNYSPNFVGVVESLRRTIREIGCHPDLSIDFLYDSSRTTVEESYILHVEDHLAVRVAIGKSDKNWGAGVLKASRIISRLDETVQKQGLREKSYGDETKKVQFSHIYHQLRNFLFDVEGKVTYEILGHGEENSDLVGSLVILRDKDSNNTLDIRFSYPS